MIRIGKAHLDKAVTEGIINQSQASELWTFLNSESPETASYNAIHFLYFFGGMICILAMTFFMNLGWEQFGGPGLTIISFLYLIAFATAGNHLWNSLGYKIPGGILLTISVCMTPLLVYGIQNWTGFWGFDPPSKYSDYHVWVRSSWVLMSLSTVIVGGLFLRKYPVSFLTMPVAVALYYFTMDIVPLIHPYNADYWQYYKVYSVGLGLVVIAFSYLLDRKEKAVDYSFWLYLFGLMSFWGGLTSMNSDSELGKFVYFLVNLSLLFLALYLYRRAFMIFGAIGVMIYFYHLAHKVFKDSLLFPFAMTLVGLAVMYLGIRYQRNKEAIDMKFSNMLPYGLKKLRPVERI